MSLSSLVVQRGVVTFREAEEALARQVIFGGDLVTNLLEVARVSEATLLAVVAEHHELGSVPPGALRMPEEGIRALFPREEALRASVFPMSVDGEVFAIAVADRLSPEDLQRYSALVDMPVEQRIALYVRVREGLARLYGYPVEERVQRALLRLAARSQSLPPAPEPRAGSTAVSLPPRGIPTMGGVAVGRRLADGGSVPSPKRATQVPPSFGKPRRITEIPTDLAAAPPPPSVDSVIPRDRADGFRPSGVPTGPVRISGAPPMGHGGKGAERNSIPLTHTTPASPMRSSVAAPPSSAVGPVASGWGGVEGAGPVKRPTPPMVAVLERSDPIHGDGSPSATVKSPAQPEVPSESKERADGSGLQKIGTALRARTLAPVIKPARRRGPLTLELAKKAAADISDRDGFLDLFFDFAKQFFEFSIIFVVHGGVANGRELYGAGVARDRASRLGIPLDVPSVLGTAFRTANFLVTQAGAEGIDGLLAEELERPPRQNLFVAPVTVRGHVVALLYGDNGELTVDPDTSADIVSFSSVIGRSLERLILLRKRSDERRPEPTKDKENEKEERPSATPKRLEPAAFETMDRSAILRESDLDGASALVSEAPDSMPGPREVVPLRRMTERGIPVPSFDAVDQREAVAFEPPPWRAREGETTQANPAPGSDEARTEGPSSDWAPEADTLRRERSSSHGGATAAGSEGAVAGAPEQDGALDAASAGPLPNEILVRRPLAVPIPREEPEEGAPRSRRESSDRSTLTDEVSPSRRMAKVVVPGGEAEARVAAPRSRSSGALRATQESAGYRRRRSSASGIAVDDLDRAGPRSGRGARESGEIQETRVRRPSGTFDPREEPTDVSHGNPEAPAASYEDSGSDPEVTSAPRIRRTASVGGRYSVPRDSLPPAEIGPSVEPPPMSGVTGSVRPAHVVPTSDRVEAVGPRMPPPRGHESKPLPSVIVDERAEEDALVDALIERGGDASIESELLRRGERAVPSLMARFPGPILADRVRFGEPAARAHECGPILHVLAALASVATAHVLAVLNDPDGERRYWATYLLTEMPHADAIEPLIGLLSDPEHQVRRVARQALRGVHRVAPSELVRALLAGIRSADAVAEARVACVDALVDLRVTAAVPELVELLKDPEREVAVAACNGLTVITRQDYVLDVSSWRAWWARNQKRHRVEWLIDALAHESAEVRRNAAVELRAVTREYFGYTEDLPERDRLRAQQRYRDWWLTEGRSRFATG